MARTTALGPDRQHGVQQQHALLGPAVEVPACGNRCSGVVVHLLEDVLQRGWEGDAVADREAESVGLPGTVIGVLSDDDDLQLLERTFVEGPEDIASAGEDAAGGVLLADEVGELGEVGFFEFRSEDLLPVRGDLYIHVTKGLK